MDIKTRECRFVVFLEKIEGVREDAHIVKELVTYNDGTTEKKLRLIPNFKRPFYVTKPHYQKHKKKHESEDLEKLNTYYSTQSDLGKEACSRLGGYKYVGKNSIYDAKESPYLYGVEVDSRTLLKHMYAKKYPGAFTPFDVAVLDIEINIQTEEIVIISIATKNKVYVGILESILQGRSDAIKQLEYLYKQYIPQTEISKNITPEFYICKTEEKLLKTIIGKAHEARPDFLAIWNINFDIPHIIKRCEKFEIDIAELFSDPGLPKEYKQFKYIPSMNSRVTASGVSKLYSPWEQWHLVKVPASFYLIDAMCAYYYVRVGGKFVPGGYSLNNILEYELGKEYKKLKFPNLAEDFIEGAEWHNTMLKDFPLEYIIYNIWDVISVLELDNKTKDLSFSVPSLSGDSSFDNFKSNPKIILDNLHFFYLERGKVLGTAESKRYSKKKPDINPNLLGLDGWIVNLRANRIRNIGYKCIEEDPDLVTNVTTHALDNDAVSAYPNAINAANVSRETTSKEIISIEGMEKDDFMLQNINAIMGKINSIEYCTEMLNFPTFEEIKKIIENERNNSIEH